MARSIPLSRILTWLAVIAAALLVVWLLMRGRRATAVETAPPSDRIAAPVSRVRETLPPLDQGRVEGDVDRALYTELRERLNSEADGSVAEVESVLRGLRARLLRGEPLTVFVPFEPGPRILTGQDQFDDWAQRWFPGASLA